MNKLKYLPQIWKIYKLNELVFTEKDKTEKCSRPFPCVNIKAFEKHIIKELNEVLVA
jgi:hypothetical protein